MSVGALACRRRRGVWRLRACLSHERFEFVGIDPYRCPISVGRPCSCCDPVADCALAEGKEAGRVLHGHQRSAGRRDVGAFEQPVKLSGNLFQQGV